MYDDELMHYGVLGMKWGQHKAKLYNANARRASKKAKEEALYAKELNDAADSYANSAKRAKSKWKAKRLNKMSDDARRDANMYWESAAENKAIAEYQKKKR